MKNIKRFLVVAFAFLVTVSLTGCGKKAEKSTITPAEAFSKSEVANADIDNYKMDMIVDFKASQGGVTQDMHLKTASTVDAKNKTLKATTTVTGTGMGDAKAEVQSYAIYDDTTTTTYTGMAGIWMKQVTNLTGDPNSISKMGDMIKSDDAVEVEPDSNNYNYELTISKEKMVQILAESSEDLQLSTEEIESAITNDVKIQVSLDRDTYRLSKISMDLTDMLKNLDMDGVTIEKAKYEFKFYSYNKAGNVVIPQDVISNAIDTSAYGF